MKKQANEKQSRFFRTRHVEEGFQRSTVVLVILIAVGLLGLGSTLIAVGIVYTIQDLLILGPIFLLTGIVFSVIALFKLCHFVRDQLKKRQAEVEPENPPQITETNIFGEPVFLNGGHVLHKRPASEDLYSRNPTPASFSGVEVTVTSVPRHVASPTVCGKEQDTYYMDGDDDIDMSHMNRHPSPVTLYSPKSKKNPVDVEHVTSHSPPPPPVAHPGVAKSAKSIEGENSEENIYSNPNSIPDAFDYILP